MLGTNSGNKAGLWPLLFKNERETAILAIYHLDSLEVRVFETYFQLKILRSPLLHHLGLTLGRVCLMWLNQIIGEHRVIFLYSFIAIGYRLIQVWQHRGHSIDNSILQTGAHGVACSINFQKCNRCTYSDLYWFDLQPFWINIFRYLSLASSLGLFSHFFYHTFLTFFHGISSLNPSVLLLESVSLVLPLSRLLLAYCHHHMESKVCSRCTQKWLLFFFPTQ